MTRLTPWFSDAPTAPAPLPYCLVCFGYGGIQISHDNPRCPR